MSIFGKILGGVFGKKKQKEHEEKEVASSNNSGNPITDTIENVKDAFTGGGADVAAAEQVDVDAVLSSKAAASSESLDWKTSIVDLLKLLGIDSSYGARKELAAEVGISGYEGTAEQNIEMHKVVIKKLAENGGIVPADLLD